MKIRFLNDELTEARITRGIWPWRRTAHVRLHDTGSPIRIFYWVFAATGDECDPMLNGDLKYAADQELRRRFESESRRRNWS